jgi:hypothetical protein
VPSEAVNETTRREWRDLGFFYDRDDNSKAWRIVGTRAGLVAFGRALSHYASNPKNDAVSEHQHLGPYMYLEIGTCAEPEITDHWIAGPLQNLASLASLVERGARELNVGAALSLRSAYAPRSPYDLILELRADGFDPAKEDAACW